VLANLLCRLPEPTKCLLQLNDLMNPGGILALYHAYSLLDEFTEEGKWFGGTVANPGASRVVSEMVLAQEFDQVHGQGMLLSLREHERKYQYIVSHGTVYQEK
jgi:hypothetical protein